MIAFTPADLDSFLSQDKGEPVVMLNLLRFRPDGGRERYLEYVNMMGPLVTRYGAKILYAGDGATPLAAEPGQAFHRVADEGGRTSPGEGKARTTRRPSRAGSFPSATL